MKGRVSAIGGQPEASALSRLPAGIGFTKERII
jgi:hypothetical protein